jgi:spore coat protein SA
MKIIVILPEIEPFAKTGGALATRSFSLFSRIAGNNKIIVFSPYAGKYAFSHPTLERKTIYAGFLQKIPFLSDHYFSLYAKEISLRIPRDAEIAYIYNRPSFVFYLKKNNFKGKIVLDMGNDHLIQGDLDKNKACIDLADLIFVNSRYLLDGIIRHFPRAKEKVYVSYNSIELSSFYPKQEFNKSLSSKALKTVLFVGRLSEVKGVHFLIQAMAKVFIKFPDVRLLIVGSSWFGTNASTPYVKSLKVISKNFQRKIIFTGYVRSDLISSVYRSADIFVAPSVWPEAFGNMNLEAMACGLPVISANRGGIPEVVGDAGILLDPENVNILSEKISLLLQDQKLREDLGRAARARVERLFNWDNLAKEVETKLRGILLNENCSDCKQVS